MQTAEANTSDVVRIKEFAGPDANFDLDGPPMGLSTEDIQTARLASICLCHLAKSSD